MRILKIAVLILFVAFLPKMLSAQTYVTNLLNGTLYKFNVADGFAEILRSDASGNFVIPSSVYNPLSNGMGNYTVTGIDKGAFYGNGLTSIAIPNSVTSIGDEAFFGCAGLTSVTIPNSVISLGDSSDDDGVFGNCTSLTNVVIGDSVTVIGANAFEFDSLISLIIPSSVISIGAEAFSGNYLTSVIFPNSVAVIGAGAFSYNGLTYVCFEGNEPDDGGDIFSENPLSTINYVNGTTGWGATFDNNGAGPIPASTCAQCATSSPPEITSQPVNQTVTVGQSVSFTVNATGSSPLSYQWVLNGTNVPGADAATLTIPSASLADAGTYDVVVTNLYGAVTNLAGTLSVETIPSFATNGSGIQINHGVVTLQIDGLTGIDTTVVQASSNLLQWVPFYTNSTSSGTIQVIDTNGAAATMRFYRIVVLP